MRALILVAGAALALSACDSQSDLQRNTVTVDENVIVDEPEANDVVIEDNGIEYQGEVANEDAKLQEMDNAENAANSAR